MVHTPRGQDVLFRSWDNRKGGYSVSKSIRGLSTICCVAAAFLFGIATTSIGAEEPPNTLPAEVEEALETLSAYLGGEEVLEQITDSLQARQQPSARGNLAPEGIGSVSEQPLPAHPGPELVAVPKSGTAQEGIQVDGYKVLTAGPAPLVIPAAAFSPDGHDFTSGNANYFFPFSSGYVQGGPNAYGCLMAPAYLPNGVTVQEMWSSVYDNDASFNVFVTLWRVDNFTGTPAEIMAQVVTESDSTSIQALLDASIVGPVVEYPTYSYYVTTCLQSADIRLYSVRLYFQ